VTQTVANAVYPFLYGRVVFSFRQCEAVGGVRGAEQNPPWHTPDYDDSSLCGGIGCVCDDGPHWFIGFSHSAVNTRNLSRLKTGNEDVDTTEHCLGVVWSTGGKIDLFSLLAANHWSFKDDLHFTSDNLTVNDNGELVFGGIPEDMAPSISLVKLHYTPNQDTDQVFDKLWVVVNRPDTETRFNNWYAQNVDIGWTTNLPPPLANITINISNGATNAVDPEPNLFGGLWGSPHSISSYLHHDAKHEMRSGPVAGGHSHQATYDEDGVLVENPIAAGTSDISAPYYANGIVRGVGTFKHLKEDVQPFFRALQLDGNPVHPTDVNRNLNRPCIYKGSNTDRYIERRPVLP
jgi:hypothetical protein